MAKKITYYLLLAISILIFITVIVLVSFEIAYAYKFYPHTYVDKIDLSGKTKSQAVEYLTKKTDPLIVNGLEFVWQDKKINIDSLITGGGDIYEEIYSYDIRPTVNLAYNYGRRGDWQTRFKEQFKTLFKKNIIPIQFALNEEGLETILRDNFLELEKPAIDAEFEILAKDDIATINIKEDVAGQTFDYKQAIAEVKNNLSNLQQKDIALQIKEDEPNIKKTEVKKIIPEAQSVLELAPVTFSYNDNNWELSKAEFATWLKLKKENDEVELKINKAEAEKFLSAVAVDIDIEALDAKFEMVDKRVTQFQSSRTGLKLDIKKTIQEVSNKLLKEKINNIKLVVDQIESKVQNEDVNDLGIIELIGRGISDFSGSPKNRIHNITNGANTLNGLLIKPGEEFSLIKTLGEIDGDNGYLQELVIKGNKTIPEYGGGLCQIGTTTFRVALQSGLPITERRNHSYNVSYYAPTGSDATIYGPHPDMRFLNDTGQHILFLTKIEGNKLVFELWGTRDNRKVKFIGKEETSDFTKLTPIVYNTVKPGAPKYIETDTLPPGKKKRLEYGHTGADAKFDYIVTYSDSEVKEETFKSHYVPWRAVWLIGKDKKEEEENTETQEGTTENKTNNESGE